MKNQHVKTSTIFRHFVLSLIAISTSVLVVTAQSANQGGGGGLEKERASSLVGSETVTFEKFEIPGMGVIEIPSSMELKTGVQRELINQFVRRVLEFDASNIIFFGSKGPTNSNLSGSTYAAVVLFRGTDGSEAIPSDFSSSASQKFRRFDRDRKAAIEEVFSRGNIPGLINQRMLEWYGSKLERINGIKTISFSYLRQLNDQPPVYVQTFTIERNGKPLVLTVSYRKIHEQQWKSSLIRVRDSFISGSAR